MIKKANLSESIGMILLVLCATLVVAVLPAAADYDADKPLVEYKSGTVIGGCMNYTIGDSYYSSQLWNNDIYTVNLTPCLPCCPCIPYGYCDLVEARLYVYWTWSYLESSNLYGYDTSILPNMTVNMSNNGAEPTTLGLDAMYWDSKDITQINTSNVKYNYPCGTSAYNVTESVTDCGPYTVNVTVAPGELEDQSVCIQGVALLTIWNCSNCPYCTYNKTRCYYWIDEGCDMTNVDWNESAGDWKYDVAPSEAMTWANFSNMGTFTKGNATLITAVPAGDTIYNKLIFNNFAYPVNFVWYSVWPGIPYSDLSWNKTDVSSAYQPDAINYALICNGWDDDTHSGDKQMQAAGAFLLVKEGEGGGDD